MTINWQQRREVFLDHETGEAFVHLGGGLFMDFEDYRSEGGNTFNKPTGAKRFGIFNNAEICQMDYPA